MLEVQEKPAEFLVRQELGSDKALRNDCGMRIGFSNIDLTQVVENLHDGQKYLLHDGINLAGAAFESLKKRASVRNILVREKIFGEYFEVHDSQDSTQNKEKSHHKEARGGLISVRTFTSLGQRLSSILCDMFSARMKLKQIAGAQELTSESMTHTRSMQVAMEELLNPKPEKVCSIEESDDGDSGGDDVEEVQVVEKFDTKDKETEVWLKRIGLYDYACLPWAIWEKNEFAERQHDHLRKTTGYITDGKEVTPQLIADVFKVPHYPGQRPKKISDAVMKAEFGAAEGTRSYYMVRNCGKLRSVHLFWYLDKVCLLAKTAYMSKEAFAPIYHAERGSKVDWATYIFDRMQLIEMKDKRRSPSIAKVSPYLAALFSYALKVPIIPSATPSNISGKAEHERISEHKKRKLVWDSTTQEKGQTSSQGYKGGESPVKQKEAAKISVFPQKAVGPKAESKNKVITLFPKRPIELTPIKSVPFSHDFSVKPGGIFSVHDAVRCLTDLNHFICNQDAKVITLEEKQADDQRIGTMEREIRSLQEQIQ